MKRINTYFKAIDTFLTRCVKYFETKIVTGKVIGDMTTQEKRLNTLVEKKSKEYEKQLEKATFLQKGNKKIMIFWNIIQKIHWIEDIIYLLITPLKIVITSYRSLFFLFVIAGMTIIIIMDYFGKHIVLFFFILPFIVCCNTFCSALFYTRIEQRETEEPTRLREDIWWIAKNILLISFPSLFYTAFVLGISVISLIFINILRYCFELFSLDLGGSFFFWFCVITLGVSVLIASINTIILSQLTFFEIILRHASLTEGIDHGWKRIKNNSFHYYFYSFMIALICLIITIKMAFITLYLGITAGLYLYYYMQLLLLFLLQKRQPIAEKKQQSATKPRYSLKIIVVSIMLFGIVNYFLFAVFVSKNYQPIIHVINNVYADLMNQQQMESYSNKQYHYTIAYPSHWAFYQWKENTVTFYNNNTGTINGGTWLTIMVTPFATSQFTQYYQASPGVVLYEMDTKNVTTKITNLSLQGYSGVQYISLKTGIPYNHYEKHFIVHKSDFVYEIVFATLTNETTDNESALIDKIFNSFKFIQ